MIFSKLKFVIICKDCREASFMFFRVLFRILVIKIIIKLLNEDTRYTCFAVHFGNRNKSLLQVTKSFF